MRRPRVWNYQVLAQRRFQGRLLGCLALLAFVFLVSVSIRLLFLRSPRQVTIGSGKTEGAVHQFLLSLAKDSARSELDIQPEMASGTIHLLDQVHSGALDFAIVHGGFDMDHYHNIRQIGVLSVAPVHLLVKNEHHAAVIDDLQNLRRPEDQPRQRQAHGDLLVEPGSAFVRRARAQGLPTARDPVRRACARE